MLGGSRLFWLKFSPSIADWSLKVRWKRKHKKKLLSQKQKYFWAKIGQNRLCALREHDSMSARGAKCRAVPGAQFTSSKWIDVRNLEEAEYIGSLISLTVFQFLLWFPSEKWHIRERERNEKNLFPKFRNWRGMKKTFPTFGIEKGMKKKAFPNFGNGNQKAFITRNRRERQFLLALGQ